MTLTVEDQATTSNFTRDKLFIGGRWREPAGTRRIDIINPATEEVIGSVPAASEADTDAAVEAAVAAFAHGPWPKLSFKERGTYLARIADELERRSDQIAEAYVKDFGGLIEVGRAFAHMGAGILRQHRDMAETHWQEPERRVDGGVEALIAREPVGPVLGIVPWNSTFVITILKLAPALLAGCPIVIKIAPESPLNSFVIADAIAAADLPEGLVSFLPGNRKELGNIAARPEFRHISFTGSTPAGTQIMTTAAANITAVTLELGGKSPAIFLDDFDPADAAVLLPATLGQAGQTCTTYSRLLVPASREEEWRTALAGLFGSVVLGDPADPATQMGPLLNEKHRKSVEAHIDRALKDGATILTGGSRPTGFGQGFYLQPTIITDVTQEMAIVQEEVFGPVLTLQTYQTIDEAIEMANDSEYGLAAGVYGHDETRALEIAARLQAGNVSLNGLFGSCIFMPFGGYKKSGLGREGGPEGVEELLEIKQIQLRRAI
ncbi:aldehyde dehydrogenase family protein [Arthrobacter sp. W4I7]|uniref:aldehyde dehydrogenase family protein n=1 Tax=Arthrobacter sp. W4I7 TaxID=3042296 RepID=UPI0027820FF8|nr:aldehyde dehydrogenase family protein [Arthrobacter sp. W4I7]MDQ0691443.1 aldehyde dehydrogenase (NAD+) [Arthrobacter sp. W4I7]